VPRLILAILLVPAFVYGAADDERGWSFSGRFQGTSNAAGLVLKANPSVGYRFNDHIQLYSGLPYYFTRQSPIRAGSGSTTFVNGIGNAFAGFLVSANTESVRYSSDLVVTAPTGDRARGFSTGHVTADWTNTFSRPYSRLTPYGSVGAANTVSDTEFFLRPFTTRGAVFHFEGGAVMKLVGPLNAGASAYGVRAAGEQEIVSKVVEGPVDGLWTPPPLPRQTNGVLSSVTPVLKTAGLGATADKAVFETTHRTTTTAAAVNDYGASTWLTFRANAMTDFQIGYSRSVSYQLNSIFFGVGFHAGH